MSVLHENCNHTIWILILLFRVLTTKREMYGSDLTKPTLIHYIVAKVQNLTTCDSTKAIKQPKHKNLRN